MHWHPHVEVWDNMGISSVRSPCLVVMYQLELSTRPELRLLGDKHLNPLSHLTDYLTTLYHSVFISKMII